MPAYRHIDIDLVKEWLFYDQDSGKLFWRKRKSNVRSGAEAGCVVKYKTGVYRNVQFFGKAYGAHRLIWSMCNGKIPIGMQIDHIDGDGLNNRISNLRIVTCAANAKNMALHSKNTSGFPGVYFDSVNLKWKALIQVDNVVKSLGYFKKFEDAVFARKAGEKKYGFHRNHGRPLMRSVS